ncbi:MAG: amidohydrolase family protein [Clostridia bacterium]|nr:amidohydrolase family protein [Clostridia bacterium]
MYDIIIKNGYIADGSGKDAYKADLAVKDGRIAKIGDLAAEQAERVIDAAGKYVTPGFIDTHSHADMSLLVWQKNEAYTLQGVTTQICGNCGLAAAPIGDEVWEFWCWEYKSMNKVYNKIFEMYNFQTSAPEMKKQLKEDYGLDVSWKTLGEFMELAEKRGFSCNYYPLSGHNHIRNAVMGREHRPATPEELEKMKAILRDDMEHGSQGLSTGLDYLPGRFATTEEVEELIKVVKEYGGVYNTHTRNFDPEDKSGAFNGVYGVREATELCRRTGVKTNIAHMAPLFTYGPMTSPEMERAAAVATVAELERGWREEGLPIMYDVIANPSMGGSTTPHLITLVRPWVLMCGSVEEFIKRLEYPDFVQMIKDQAASGKVQTLNTTLVRKVAAIYKTASCKEPKYANKTLAQIMRELGTEDMVDALLTVLKADPYTCMTLEMWGGDEGVRTLLASERSMPCSDGFSFDLDTQMDLPYPFNRPPHPNNFCYAVRHLLNYGGPRFEDKIKQMTSVPAEWFNIYDRGTLEEGKWADIVVIDRENLRTNEDAVEPGKAPDGIDYVLINGVVAAEHKKHTGALAGKVLRRQ